MRTRHFRYLLGSAFGTAAAIVFALSVHGATEGLLTGAVTSTRGTPIEGVIVSAQIEGEPITTSVYTQADGRYFFPPMKAGKYKVWAQSVGLERSEATADLGASTKRVDFKMKEATDLFGQVSGYQVVAALPEDTPAHRRGKVLFQKNCTYCHETATALRDRFDHAGWENIVDAMMNGFRPGPKGTLAPWMKELATYLAEMRGPGASPMKPLQIYRPKGEATLPVVYLYDVEYIGGGYSAHNGDDWRFGQASSAGGAAGMHDGAMDADGNFWLTSTRNSKERTVARVDGQTGKLTNYPVIMDGGQARLSHGIFPASDGKIYFNASPKIAYLDGVLGIIDPKASKVESIVAPAGVGGWLNQDAKGFIWTQSGNMKEGGAVRFDPRTKKFDVFKSPTAGLTYGVAGDSDGNGWWMGVNDDVIVHGEAATGKVTEIKLPEQPATEYVKPGDFAEGEDIPRRGLGGRQSPRRPSADLAGNALWVPNFYGNTLVKIDTRTKAVKYYKLPYSAMNPYEAMVDSKHHVWVSFQNSDEVGRFDPDTEKWTIYSWPMKGAAQRQNHVLEKDGVLNIVLASGPGTRTGRMVMRSAQDVQALRAKVR